MHAQPVRFAQQVACQRHWSKWQQASPYQVTTSNGDVCSVGCTKAATEEMMRTTGGRQGRRAALQGELRLPPGVLVPCPVLPWVLGFHRVLDALAACWCQ